MKKLKLSMIFAAVALLAIGCSNLWDYDPPKTNTPPPITNNDPPLKELKYWVDDGTGTPKEVTVKTTGDEATLEEIKGAYGAQYGTPKLPAGYAPGEWVESDLTTPATGGSTTYPSGDTLGIKITYTPPTDPAAPDAYILNTAVNRGGDVVGNRKPVELPKDASGHTLADILGAAGLSSGNNYAPSGIPAGLEFKGWVKSGETSTLDPTAGTKYPAGTNFEAIYTAWYSLDLGGSTETPKFDVSIADATKGKTLKEIFAKAGVTDIKDATTGTPPGKDFAAGWEVTLPDGQTIIVSSDQIIDDTKGIGAEPFPPGTTIKPHWVVNGEGGAAGDPGRNLTSTSKNDPEIGDWVTVDSEGNGHIFPKGKPVTDLNGEKVLGYVYAVDTTAKTVNVVAKDIRKNIRWANGTGDKVYSGDNGGSSNKSYSDSTKYPNKLRYLRQWMADLESGYDTWVNRISMWNTTALYGNYQAIKYALCYPRMPKNPDKFNEWLIGEGSTPGVDPSPDEKNKPVKNIVNGSSPEDRWYLPSVKELKKVYDARSELKNWDPDNNGGNIADWGGPLLNNKFWAVDVSLSTEGTKNLNGITDADKDIYDNWAQYVEFAGSGANVLEANKYSGRTAKDETDKAQQPEPVQCVLAVSLFNYEISDVNH